MPEYRKPPVKITVIEEEHDGTRRIARAVQGTGGDRGWQCQLEHPVAGASPNVIRCSNVYGTRGDAAVALAHYLNETANRWSQEKARGHRPEPTVYDPNRSLPETGEFSPVKIYAR